MSNNYAGNTSTVTGDIMHTAAANGRWCGANGHDAVSAVGLKMAI